MELTDIEKKILSKVGDPHSASMGWTLPEKNKWKVDNLHKLGLVKLSKIYCGPLKIFTGEYQIILTDKGKAFNEKQKGGPVQDLPQEQSA